MDRDEILFGRALRRIGLAISVLTAAGALACLYWRGPWWAAGFLVGAGASYLNFRWLRQFVESLGQAATKRRTRKRVAVLAGLRYLLLGGAAYVIVRFSAISLHALLWGLFVPVAAVIVEILLELIYGT